MVKDEKGFTLIELLVVIVIIGVLIGILVPVIKGSIDQAKTALCMNNLRQIYLGIAMYTDDHDGIWPSSHTPGGGGYTESSYMWDGSQKQKIGILYPEYIDDIDVFYCPIITDFYLGQKSNFGQPGLTCLTNYFVFFYGTSRLDELRKRGLVTDSSRGSSFPCTPDDGPHKRIYNVLGGDGVVRKLGQFYGGVLGD